MRDVEKRALDRIGEKLPNRVETYSDIWAEEARSAYPEFKPGQKTPESLVFLAASTRAEQIKLPVLEFDMGDAKAPADPALAKVEKIAAQLKSDDFEEREKGSVALGDLLRTELAGKKLTPALEKIFQLAASEDAEVSLRVLARLKPHVTDAVNEKNLSLLKLFLSRKEVPLRDLAVKEVQESPEALKILAKLVPMAQTESDPGFVEAIRQVADAVCTKSVVNRFRGDVQGPITDKLDMNRDFVEDKNIADLDDDERAKWVKGTLAAIKHCVKEADDAQSLDVAVIARFRYTPEESKKPWGFRSDDIDLILAHPSIARVKAGRVLKLMAEKLKSEKTDQATFDLLQAAVISYYKESLYMAPDAAWSSIIRSQWAGPDFLESLRKLNPSQFDSLVPDKLLPDTFKRE